MELKKYKLTEFLDSYGDGIHGTPEYDDNGEYYFINGNNLKDGKIEISENTLKVSTTEYNKIKRNLTPNNALLVSINGTLGNVAFYNDEKIALGKSACFLNLKKEACRNYIRYVFETKEFKTYMNRVAGQSTIKNVSPTQISEYDFFAPNLQSQQKIAAVLSTLDNKIALNRRINSKLEAIAKRLYDYWFVQFDFPNTDGKPYKSSGGKMEYNDVLKRKIPAGWEVKRLGDVCEIVLGGTPSTSNEEFWNNGTLNWLNSGEVASFPIVSSEKKITEAALKQSATEFLKAGSVTLSITRYLRPSILAIDACINQSVVGIKENDTFKSCFLYPYLQNEIDRLMSLRTGAQQPHINKETVEASSICVPSVTVMEKYIEKSKPIYDEIVNIAKETDKLTAMRDRLLPLLMNGQVEVK